MSTQKSLFFIRKSSQKVLAQQNMRNWLILTYPIIIFGNECPIGVHKKLLPYVLMLPFAGVYQLPTV